MLSFFIRLVWVRVRMWICGHGEFICVCLPYLEISLLECGRVLLIWYQIHHEGHKRNWWMAEQQQQKSFSSLIFIFLLTLVRTHTHAHSRAHIPHCRNTFIYINAERVQIQLKWRHATFRIYVHENIDKMAQRIFMSTVKHLKSYFFFDFKVAVKVGWREREREGTGFPT